MDTFCGLSTISGQKKIYLQDFCLVTVGSETDTWRKG